MWHYVDIMRMHLARNPVKGVTLILKSFYEDDMKHIVVRNENGVQFRDLLKALRDEIWKRPGAKIWENFNVIMIGMAPEDVPMNRRIRWIDSDTWV
jgi:hypothetical protein